jgi:hypothetical protein
MRELFWPVLALLSFTACGELLPPISRSVSASTSTSSNTSLTGDWSCPSQANVIPLDDVTLTGSIGFYKVCTSPSNNQLLKISGATRSSNVICLFPADQTSNGAVTPKKDTRGMPIAICKNLSDATAQGLSIDLNSSGGSTALTFNYLFIVESQDALSMQNYLATGNRSYQPDFYSQGRIRN